MLARGLMAALLPGVLLPGVLLLGAPPSAAGTSAATGPERQWSASTASADVGATLEREGNRESLVLHVHPHAGVRIEPPVLRVDAPALMRGHIAVKFPTTVRTDGKGRGGAVRAALPLDRPGAVRFGTADRNDGALRIEYRYCLGTTDTCSVEQVDIALRAGP